MVIRRKAEVSKHNIQAFFELVRGGVWENEAHLSQYWVIDFDEVYRLAKEQSVVGLVAAGIEHVTDVKLPQNSVLPILSDVLLFEKRNKAMNYFIAELIEKMRDAGIYALLVKGQGIAQCYERPLWRACGDIDLLLSDDNYSKASFFLKKYSSHIDEELNYRKHISMIIDNWIVEIHGTLRSELGGRIDRIIDKMQEKIFYEGAVRSWMNGQSQIFMPKEDEDVVFIFCHILQHFFCGGIGLRQVCDWCRLLKIYHKEIDAKLLKSRLREAGLISEWKTFSALAVDTLGTPAEVIPLYSSSKKWSKKAEKVLAIILETGNFGHNLDVSYYEKYPFVIYKAISLWRNTKENFRHCLIFPKDATRIWFLRLLEGFRVAVRGK